MYGEMLKCAVAAVVLAQSATADEIAFGIGWDDMFDAGGRESLSFLFEYHADPFFEGHVLNLALMAVIQADDRGDIFAGVGVHNRTDIGRARRFFLEASLAVGHFDEGGNTGTRDNGTRFRTSLGAGVHLSERERLSLTLDHILDMDFKNDHPGSETLHLRYSRAF
ncbi:hypothetical protein GFB49_12595 [Epibacterium sp. SM1979]|uniref:Lipid A 3-O-deacylase (PagL) n=1 Tax=Tritonibacter litoralis TaxID=2662264 RepID=A0A843YHJ9_9RHOB|nr:acyloxyacyl hydrolase [Tritonibacter litoralis]MQQ09298.1 hypothetical protein [Tritonibacter litoralis]